MTDPRRSLPQVDELARSVAEDGRTNVLVRDAARDVVARARESIERGIDPGDLHVRLAERLRRIAPLAPVINATGILLHTNLGRAPLRHMGLDRGATALELDLGTGLRGARFAWVEHAAASLCGAEAALVVNNNAAGVLLTLATLAGRAAPAREIVVSRGELVEIGGGFRVPEVIEAGGAELHEVGTTNRTHPHDYEAAIGDSTAAVLKVHPSNYTVSGFTSEVGIDALAELCSEVSTPLVFDIGSGLLDMRLPWLDELESSDWLRAEPGARQAIGAGCDIVTFSGDKLLGGPQCGVIVGHRELVDAIRRHPLARAVRFDRVRAQLLQATLAAYLDGSVVENVPFWRLAATPIAEVEARAEALAGAVGGRVVATQAAAGAGSTPGQTLSSFGVALKSAAGPDAVVAALRSGDPPVIAKIADARALLDLRSVLPEDDGVLVEACKDALA